MNIHIAKKIWNPGMFQGANKKRNYFEGWYYKIVDSGEKNIFAVIPGISLAQNQGESHSFIQVINGKTNMSYYYNFKLNDFMYSKDKFEIRIGENRFSDRGISLNIKGKNEYLKCELNFENLVKWPTTLFSPGVMGWYSFVPFMECYHGVLSMNHWIKGGMKIEGNDLDFTGGRGYIEKDWGESFPSSWIWMQSNHFEVADASIMISIANIPWLRGHFPGFIMGFWYRGRIYRFTSYTGAKIKKVSNEDGQISIHAVDSNYELRVEARQSGTGQLKSPMKGAMKGKINESMTGTVKLYLSELSSGRIVFNGEGRNAGIEVMGDMNELLKVSE